MNRPASILAALVAMAMGPAQFAAPTPTFSPTPDPTAMPTLNPTSEPTSPDTVTIVVSVVMETYQATVTDQLRGTLEAACAVASGVDEADIKDFRMDVALAQRRLSESQSRGLAAEYTWEFDYKVVSSLDAVGHLTVNSYQTEMEINLQQNLASAVVASTGITIVVTSITTKNASTNKNAPDNTPTAAPKRQRAGLSMASTFLVSFLVVVLVTSFALYTHHKATKKQMPGQDTTGQVANPMGNEQNAANRNPGRHLDLGAMKSNAGTGV
mmetsp:Transcript_67681/g.153171  ORF Transcript_67681/g.153171 Transcript_67681/m.153171 type:complete len:269 (+) Transcript_67681:110-916(+)